MSDSNGLNRAISLIKILARRESSLERHERHSALRRALSVELVGTNYAATRGISSAMLQSLEA